MGVCIRATLMSSELFANAIIDEDHPIVQAHMKTITPMGSDTSVTFLYK
jgi:hypothetical protein